MSKIYSAQQEKERSKVKNAEKWARMLTDPDAPQVVAPTYMPRPTCSSSLVHSIDVPYSSTNAGYVTIGLVPEAGGTYMVSAVGNYPPVGTGEFNMYSVDGSTTMGINGFLSQGLFAVKSAEGSQGYVGMVEGSTVSAFRAGQGLIPLRCPIGTDIILYIDAGNSLSLYSIYEVDAAGAANLLIPIQDPNQTATFTTTLDMEYVMVGLVNSGGGTLNPAYPLPFSIALYCKNSIVPSGTAQFTSVVKSQLLEQANVSHAFMTAGQMLVTNLASPYDAGGEIVVARVLKKELARRTTQDLMDHIKSLSEKRMWSSRSLIDGGFVWYLPDDLDSYQPRSIHDEHSDNVLIACIKMASPQGQVRVNFTTKWDYYTPSQILTKRVGHTWCPASLALLDELVNREATSANSGHLALIAGAKALASGVTNFYLANKTWIDPLLLEGATYVGKKIVDKANKKGSAKGKQEAPKKGK